ncbi:MAG TPA: hypothetical protein VK705_09750, partial [Ferruginibacter sp.]|nr:hypothetical protein [Ferruginibacter sp.]
IVQEIKQKIKRKDVSGFVKCRINVATIPTPHNKMSFVLKYLLKVSVSVMSENIAANEQVLPMVGN